MSGLKICVATLLSSVACLTAGQDFVVLRPTSSIDIAEACEGWAGKSKPEARTAACVSYVYGARDALVSASRSPRCRAQLTTIIPGVILGVIAEVSRLPDVPPPTASQAIYLAIMASAPACEPGL